MLGRISVQHIYHLDFFALTLFVNNQSSNSYSSIGGHLLRPQSAADISLFPQFRGAVYKVSQSIAEVHRENKYIPLGGSSPADAVTNQRVSPNSIHIYIAG